MIEMSKVSHDRNRLTSIRALQGRKNLDCMPARPQPSQSETAPDAWASKMLLLHIDRRHHHCHVNLGVDRLFHLPTSHNHKVSAAASFNLLSFKPPSPYLSALYLVRHELDRIPPKPASGGSSRPGLFENRALCRSSGETQSSATTSVT